MRGVTPEYSDALIQHHVTNGLTYVPQIVDQFTEVDGMVEQDKILVYTLGLLLIYLALDEYIWGLWFTNGVVHMEGFWEVAGLEM